LSDFVVFNYVILNGGHSDQKTIDDKLTNVTTTLSTKGVEAATKAIGKGLANLLGAEIGSAVLPLVGSALGALAGWLVGGLTDLLFADCENLSELSSWRGGASRLVSRNGCQSISNESVRTQFQGLTGLVGWK